MTLHRRARALLDAPNILWLERSSQDSMAGQVARVLNALGDELDTVQQPPPLLLKPAEVAYALRISRSYAYQLIQDGTIPSVTVGSVRRVSRDVLDHWVKQQEGGGPVSS